MTPMPIRLQLDEIRLTEGPPLNTKTLGLVAFMQSGGEPEPITVVWINSFWRVVDGRHRWTAHQLLERPDINAVVLSVVEGRPGVHDGNTSALKEP